MAKKVKKKTLGKGIGALLSNIKADVAESPEEEIVVELASATAEIPLSSIEVNPFQPRKEFDPEALKELSESIKVHGLIQPITVRRLNSTAFQLISGERRFRASKLAGLTEIPAFVRLANDQEMLEMALVENIQREELNAMEIAFTYQRLIDECQLTHEKLSDRVGKNRSSVSNYLRLIKLPPDIQKGLKEKVISMGHARCLVGVSDPVVQIDLYKKTIDNKLSVRDLEALVRELEGTASSASKGSSSTPVLPFEYKKVLDGLKEKLGSRKVDLSLKSKGKGKIVFKFNSDKELNRFLDFFED